MSHTTKVDVQMRDLEMVEKTCQELADKGFRFVVTDKVKMFEGGKEEACVAAIYVDGHEVTNEHGNKSVEGKWNYPILIKEDGSIAYDNYNGYWGDIKVLEGFRRLYTENVAVKFAESTGRRVLHRELIDGSVTLTLGR
jgi:hypothetical protein